MDKRKQNEEKQLRKKYTDVMVRKLLPKNHKYYVLDSECIGFEPMTPSLKGRCSTNWANRSSQKNEKLTSSIFLYRTHFIFSNH